MTHPYDCCGTEHKCIAHYGDQSIIRQSCLERALKDKQLSQSVAFTEWHPAYRLSILSENHLTLAELKELNKICPGNGLIPNQIGSYLAKPFLR